MCQILDGEDASGVDNNTSANAGDTSGMGDGGGSGGMDNNTDGKNAHAKAGFSTYKIADANTDVDASDTTSTGDTGGTGGADNNTDSKNAYAKAGFSNYNIASVNADAGVGAGNTNGTGEEVSNNTNNTGKGQSSGVGGANKGGLGGTNKGGVGGTNIKAGIGIDEANKGGIGGADIEAGKKADVEAVVSTDNSADSGDKITDQYAGLIGLAFAALTTANCANNSNLAIPEETPSIAATSTSNEFLATFATFANTTLKKKSKVYKSNPFLFAANH